MPATDPPEPPKLPRLPPVDESSTEAELPPEPEAMLPPEPEDAVLPPEPGSEDAAPVAETVTETGSAPTRPRPDQRRDGRTPRTEDGRRYATAGHGLIVAVLALLFGALLIAPGMHKAAFNGEQGAKRDVALALTDGLDHVSHALFLDRPRALIQDAMGREDIDEIDVAIVVPPPTVTPPPSPTTPVEKPTGKPATPKPPAKAAFTPKKKLRLWVAGDSLVITPGYSIVRAAGGSPVIQSVGGVDGHVATGLTRPDVFNWFTYLPEKMKELKPKVVVLNFGANDNHDYMTGLPEATTIGSFSSPTWNAEYRRRVAAVMDTVNGVGAVVVWIGLPVAESDTVTQEFDRINAVVQKEAKSRPGKAIFIDTYNMFAGDDGGFTEYLENARGDAVKVRAGDGVHFDTAGGDIIAREVLKRLNEQFDLTSWRNTQTK